MRIKKLKYNSWNNDTKKLLNNMTLSYDSGMLHEIKTNPEDLTTWVAFENGIPIAWACMTKGLGIWRNPSVMVYVPKIHRKRGIGRKLVDRIARNNKSKVLNVYRWNKSSGLFYSKVAPKHWKIVQTI